MPLRKVLPLFALLAATAAYAQPTQFVPGVELPAGVDVETQVTGDLNGDGLNDAAYVAHDGFETSWNLLDGDATTRELRLSTGGGDAAYNPGRERSFKRRARALWLPSSPDPETVLEEMHKG